MQHFILCSGQFFLFAGKISWGCGPTLRSKHNVKMFESVMVPFEESVMVPFEECVMVPFDESENKFIIRLE